MENFDGFTKYSVYKISLCMLPAARQYSCVQDNYSRGAGAARGDHCLSFTFLVTDVVAEIEGKKSAGALVMTGFYICVRFYLTTTDCAES